MDECWQRIGAINWCEQGPVGAAAAECKHNLMDGYVLWNLGVGCCGQAYFSELLRRKNDGYGSNLQPAGFSIDFACGRLAGKSQTHDCRMLQPF